MKKLLSILLAALCALLPLAAAETTTLKTVVPSDHTITIVCGDHGSVKVAGKTRTGTFSVKVARLGSLTIASVPSSGYALSQITAENLDGVTIKNGTATLTGVYCDNTITVSFTKSASTETTQDKTDSDDSTDNRLYDAYLGTDGDLRQLSIVFNGDYLPVDYELLNVSAEDAAQGNCLLVQAFSDDDGKISTRSLILSATQLKKLMEKQKTQLLIFENGEAFASIDPSELLNDDMQKRLALILASKEEITAEILTRDLSTMEAPTLSAAELAKIRFELRIVPVESSDEAAAYEISLWLHRDDQKLDISNVIPSLRVCLNVDAQAREAELDSFTQFYAVGHQAPEAEDFQPLESCLLSIPNKLPSQQPDTAERFIVNIPDDGSNPVVAYDADASLSPYRHYALATSYAGAGTYKVLLLSESIAE